MSFVRSVAKMSAGQFVSTGLIFVIRIVIARLLGPAGLGAFGLALNSATVYSRWSNLGIAPATQRSLSKSDEQGKVFGTSLLLSIAIAGIPSLVLLFTYPYWQSYFFSGHTLAAESFRTMLPHLAAIAFAMVASSALLAQSKAGEYAITQALPQLVLLVSLGWLYFSRSLHVVVTSQIASWWVMAAVSAWYLKGVISRSKWDRSVAKELFVQGLWLWPLTFLQYGISRIAPLMGARYLTQSELGLYIAAANVAELMLIVNAPVSQLMLTRSSSQQHDNSEFLAKVCRVTIAMQIVVGLLALALGQHVFVVFFGDEFRQSYWAFGILLVAGTAHSVVRNVVSHLVGKGRTVQSWIPYTAEVISLPVFIWLAGRSGINGLSFAVASSSLVGLVTAIILLWWADKVNVFDLVIPRIVDGREIVAAIQRKARA